MRVQVFIAAIQQEHVVSLTLNITINGFAVLIIKRNLESASPLLVQFFIIFLINKTASQMPFNFWQEISWNNINTLVYCSTDSRIFALRKNNPHRWFFTVTLPGGHHRNFEGSCALEGALSLHTSLTEADIRVTHQSSHSLIQTSSAFHNTHAG